MKWLKMPIFEKTAPRRTLDLETANRILAAAPISYFTVAIEGVGENQDETVKLLNATPSAGRITEYTYDTLDFKLFFRAYRFWGIKSGYVVKINLQCFNRLSWIDKNKRCANVDIEKVISDIKSFFRAAYLDVLGDCTQDEKDKAGFSLQFVEDL